MNLPLDAIVIGDRHRKEMGDLQALADSIAARGLLHPVVVTSDHLLVAGHRRLEAVRSLGWTEVPVTVVDNLADAEDRLRAEGEENTCREAFTPAEAVAYRRSLESLVRAEAKERQGKRTDLQPSAKLAGSERERTTRHRTAAPTGYSYTTLDKAEAVVIAAEEEPERFAPLVEEMNGSGKVDGAYQELMRQQTEQAQEDVQRFVDHATDASPEVAAGRLRAEFSKFRKTVRRGITEFDAAAVAAVLDGDDRQWAADWASETAAWCEGLRKEMDRSGLRVVGGAR